MKSPKPSKDIKDFTINAKNSQKYQIYKKLSTLPIESWTDVSKLVDAEFQTARSSKPEESHKKFLKGLATVHSKLIRHPKVQSFAQAAHTYLKAQSTKDKFITEFNTKLEKIKEEKTKAKLNKQTREISQAEVFLEDNDRLSQLHQKIDSLSAASSSAASSSSTTPASSSVAASASKPKVQSIKDKIFNHSVQLHHLYQNDKKLTTEQLKAMSIGLSCIIDLADDDSDGTLRAFLKETIWKQLYTKYLKRSKLELAVVQAALVDKWKYAVILYHQSNAIRDTKKYLTHLQSKQDITDTDTKVFEFFFEIFSLIESKSFILNKDNAAKVAERDYVYQIWTNIFTKLFSIHGNIIRIKTGETVPDNTTLSKTKLYSESTNIVGFKVDLRLILDLDEEEIDLGCGEGCLETASDTKLVGDAGKLLREGKEMEMSIREILLNGDDMAKSKVWLIQIAGTTCHFSTLQATNHHYHVNVPQFSLSFPDSFVNSESISALTHLFTFKDNIEALAMKVKNVVQWRKAQFQSEEEVHTEWCKTPENSYDLPESTWFTPPRRDKKISKIPTCTVYESDVESGDSDTEEDQDDDEEEPDIYGFVETKDGWLCTKTRVIFTTHPYQ